VVGYSEFYYIELCLEEQMVMSVFNCRGLNNSYLWKVQTFIICQSQQWNIYLVNLCLGQKIRSQGLRSEFSK